MPSLRSVQVTLAVALTLAANALIDLLPLNGRTTGEISDAFNVYVTPAAFTFSIWTVIYAGLIAYAIFQWPHARSSNRRLQQIRKPFLVSCAANAGWLCLWHYEYFASSLLAMLVLLASLVVINDRLHSIPARSEVECWMVDRVFSAYTAWIAIATLVKLAVVLDFLQLRPFHMSAVNWAVLTIGAVAGIAATVALTRKDRTFLAVFLWALLGIAMRPGQLDSVQAGAIAAAVIVAGFIGWISLSLHHRHLHA